VVYHAKLIQGGEDTAIKKVMQDRRFKVRVRAGYTTVHRLSELLADFSFSI
jgi:hypothetical protein